MDKSVASGGDDWGYQPGRGGMAIEAKLGMFIIMILVGAFAFLVYRNVDQHQKQVAATEEEHDRESANNITSVMTDSLVENFEDQPGIAATSFDDELIPAQPEPPNFAFGNGFDDKQGGFESGDLDSFDGTATDPRLTVSTDDSNADGDELGRFDVAAVETLSTDGDLIFGDETATTEASRAEPTDEWTEPIGREVASRSSFPATDSTTGSDSQGESNAKFDFESSSGQNSDSETLAFGTEVDNPLVLEEGLDDFAAQHLTRESGPAEDRFSTEDAAGWSVAGSKEPVAIHDDTQATIDTGSAESEPEISWDARIDPRFDTGSEFDATPRPGDGVDITYIPQQDIVVQNDQDAPVDLTLGNVIGDDPRDVRTDVEDLLPSFSLEPRLTMSGPDDEGQADFNDSFDAATSDRPLLPSRPHLDSSSGELVFPDPAFRAGEESALSDAGSGESSMLRPVNPINRQSKTPTTADHHDADFDVPGFAYDNRVVTASAENEPCEICEVVPGDNYWKISRRAYGTTRYFSALALYNHQRIRDPKNLRPGMKVLLPTAEVLEQKYPKLFRDSAPREHHPSGYFVQSDGTAAYRIGERDTLSQIAEKHLGRSSRWVQIYRLNRTALANPNRLKPGTVIILPDDATDVHMVP